MNTKATADAIAARFVGITANGEPLSIGPTASLPNMISKGPALLVYHPDGALDIQMRLRRDALDFPVRLLRDPVDVPARSDALYAWFDAMRDQVEKRMTLGLSYVAWAQPISSRVQLDGQPYAGALFDVVEIIVRVQYDEVVTTLSA